MIDWPVTLVMWAMQMGIWKILWIMAMAGVGLFLLWLAWKS